MNETKSTSRNSEHPDTKVFEEFYRRHYDAVSRYVSRRLPQDAHDGVIASTFVAAWRKFDAVPDPSLPWLYRIAHFEVAHEHRRARRQPLSVELQDLPITDSHPLEDVMDVSMAFSQLSVDDAELLRLVHWEGLSRDQIAEMLRCTVNTVNVRYHRAMSRLSSTLHRHSNVLSDEVSTKFSGEI